MYLICHVASQDHLFKSLCDFMGETFLICHMILQDHMIKEPRNFIVLSCLVVIGIIVVEIQCF